MNLYLILRRKKKHLEIKIQVGIPVPGCTQPKQMNKILASTQSLKLLFPYKTPACCLSANCEWTNLRCKNVITV